VTLRLRDRELELVPGQPALMGIVNATPDSFSDRQGAKDPGELVERGLALKIEGAAIVDVGGESGRTDREAVSEQVEAERIVPVIAGLVAKDVTVSVDTWRPGPARAALEAGAVMVNDVSGLAEPQLARLCAEYGAALVITHTRVEPKVKEYADLPDVMRDVRIFLEGRIALAREHGVGEDQLLLDPGLDLGKQVGESVEILTRLGELESLDRPLLLAISRKDFIGAITYKRPAERDPGTLGAVEPALDLGVGSLLRVHDVAGARDFLDVRRQLRGDSPTFTGLAPELRRETA
jgi:dihydropteroate synthase